jgi:hypothetical protein
VQDIGVKREKRRIKMSCKAFAKRDVSMTMETSVCTPFIVDQKVL